MQSSIEETIPAGNAEHKPAGWGELLSGKNGLYALALAGGVTLHAVNMYIATTVMPSVVQDIGGMDFYAWATTLFVVASILGAALTARLLKSAGPRGAYVVATLLFAAGTLISSLPSTCRSCWRGGVCRGLAVGSSTRLLMVLPVSCCPNVCGGGR